MICRKLVNMGTLLLAVVFLTLVFRNSTHAQRARMSIDDRVKMMTEQLSLTKGQADSVRKIFEATDKERSKVFGDRQGDRAAMREAMTKIMDNANKRIDSLLTDDQRKKFDEIKKQQQNRRGPPPNIPQPEKKDNQ